ncbi:MAG: bifunctional folylpolyglutamate synthase/dihydrofolate synthase [Fibrobacter sp.]|nr:bifunctional folylpolyglutamate synthase/dihydrofolate synthase [Fibrobacter sp.]
MQNAGMEYLNSRLMFGMVPGLKSTRLLCEALGNPQKKFKTIHVVGTNGKGSTSYYLAGILKSFGFRTALYTSPHLVNLRERIRVDDEPIAEADLERYLLQVKAAAELVNQKNCLGEKIEPTFFEVLTLVAFLHYANSGVDVAVLEAGMGGRLDSTAVADGGIAVVTSIGLEHTEILGATESAILKEKMAVVGESSEDASGKIFVLGGLSTSLLEDASEFASALGAKVYVPEIRNDIQLPNLGQHYVENASLSLAAAKIFCESVSVPNGGAGSLYDDALAIQVLVRRSWAGRMQTLSDAQGKVRYILDGAHNSHAVRRLVQALDKYYPGKKFHCVFGALKDKDVGEMLKLMAPYVSHWHITKTPYPRFRELEDLRCQLSGLGLQVASEGLLNRAFLDSVRDGASDDDPVLITGSLYMIGESIQALKQDFEGLSFFRGLEPTTNEHR